MKTKALDYLINRFCLERENTLLYWLAADLGFNDAMLITDGITGIRIFKKAIIINYNHTEFKFFIRIFNNVDNTYIQYRLSELLKVDNIKNLVPEDFRFS